MRQAMCRVAPAWPGVSQGLRTIDAGNEVLQLAGHRIAAETKYPFRFALFGKSRVGEPVLVADTDIRPIMRSEAQAGQRFGQDWAMQPVGQCRQRLILARAGRRFAANDKAGTAGYALGQIADGGCIGVQGWRWR